MSSPILKLPAIAGEVVVWGDNTYGQVSGRPRQGGFAKIAPGGATEGLALAIDGRPTRWGGVGATGPVGSAFTPNPGEKYIDIAISVSFAAAIRGSDLWIDTWGPFASGTNSALSAKYLGKRFIGLTVGGAFGVAICERTGLLCQWGAGEDTQPQPKGISFTDVRARNDYCVALASNQNIYGWGGKLFRPPAGSASLTSPGPSELHPLANTSWEYVAHANYWFIKGPFLAIAAGSLQKDLVSPLPHVLALTDTNTVVGWGADTDGEITKAPSVKLTAIAAGHAYSIGLDSAGMLYHWGSPGKGTGSLAAVPSGPFVSIGAATKHATALRSIRRLPSSIDG